MRIARALVLALFVVLCSVVAQAADFTITNDCGQGISAVLTLDDQSTINVSVTAYSVKTLPIGSHTVAAVTINGQTVTNGTSNQTVTLSGSTRILVTVMGDWSQWEPLGLENGANNQSTY